MWCVRIVIGAQGRKKKRTYLENKEEREERKNKGSEWVGGCNNNKAQWSETERGGFWFGLGAQVRTALSCPVLLDANATHRKRIDITCNGAAWLGVVVTLARRSVGRTLSR